MGEIEGAGLKYKRREEAGSFLFVCLIPCLVLLSGCLVLKAPSVNEIRIYTYITSHNVSFTVCWHGATSFCYTHSLFQIA